MMCLFLSVPMCPFRVQAYSSFTVETLLEQKGACVTADYDLNEDNTIAVVNTARYGKTAESVEIPADLSVSATPARYGNIFPPDLHPG